MRALCIVSYEGDWPSGEIASAWHIRAPRNDAPTPQYRCHLSRHSRFVILRGKSFGKILLLSIDELPMKLHFLIFLIAAVSGGQSAPVRQDIPAIAKAARGEHS